MTNFKVRIHMRVFLPDFVIRWVGRIYYSAKRTYTQRK